MKRLAIIISLIVGIGALLIINGKDNYLENKVLEEKRSIFISYIELGKYLGGKDEKAGSKAIEEMLENVKNLKFNQVIVQVRSFSDAIYPSSIYPWSYVITGDEGGNPGYDILKRFIEEAKKRDISVLAWVNPYRVRNTSNTANISETSPAFKYLDTSYVQVDKGIYFNPSKEEVRDLIVSGVKEIVENYQVDGILFDDYFYPNNYIDQEDYEKYVKNNDYISKNDYNLLIVNKLVREVYKVCHQAGVQFGISPDGNLDNNYQKVFADVKKWCSEDGYIDFIMPQVYYGFFNETRPFRKTIMEWNDLITNSKIKLEVALAFYKNGQTDKYAKSGSEEWINNGDIIMREIMMSRNLSKYAGFSLFRYDYIFDEALYSDMTVLEVSNMKKALN